MDINLAFFIGAFLFISFLGWRIERRLRELIKVSKRATFFPYEYLNHARTEKSYEKESNANYWLLLAIISLLSDGEF